MNSREDQYFNSNTKLFEERLLYTPKTKTFKQVFFFK